MKKIEVTVWWLALVILASPPCRAAFLSLSSSLSGVWAQPITYSFSTTSAPSATAQQAVKNAFALLNTPCVPGLSFSAATTTGQIIFAQSTTGAYCEDNTVVNLPSQKTSTTASVTITIVESASVGATCTGTTCSGGFCATQGWILHLLFHAFGFYHEHQRPDRGNYTYPYLSALGSQFSSSTYQTALWNTVPSAIITSSTYDWESVTHYDSLAMAASNTLQTLVPVYPTYWSTFSYGSATSPQSANVAVPSQLDLQALQAIFPCTTGTCATASCSAATTARCNNGGTSSPWLNWCLCPPGFYGQNCTQTYCQNACQNGGTCVIQTSTNTPGCNCPSGFSGTYCETASTTSACTCPFWAVCQTSSATCNCGPFPYSGSTCSTSTTGLATATTASTSTTTTTSTSTTSTTSTTTSTTASTTTTTSITCSASNVGSPRSVTFDASQVYMRIALTDIAFINPDYNNLGSSNSVALQSFLTTSLQGDYQTQSSGQFVSVQIMNISPPQPSVSTSGCSVVDFLAKFTTSLTALQRTRIVQATYAKSQSSLASLFGVLGSNTNQATRVAQVLYVTPLNNAISPTSPCVVYSNEGACLNGGTCTATGTTPSCSCASGFSGTYCGNTGISLNWPVWQIVVVAAACAVALLLLVIGIVYCASLNQRMPVGGMPPYAYGGNPGYAMAPFQPQQTFYQPNQMQQPGPNVQGSSFPSNTLPPAYSTFPQAAVKSYQYPYNIQ